MEYFGVISKCRAKTDLEHGNLDGLQHEAIESSLSLNESSLDELSLKLIRCLKLALFALLIYLVAGDNVVLLMIQHKKLTLYKSCIYAKTSGCNGRKVRRPLHLLASVPSIIRQ